MCNNGDDDCNDSGGNDHDIVDDMIMVIKVLITVLRTIMSIC